jgi:hypothetical protein
VCKLRRSRHERHSSGACGGELMQCTTALIALFGPPRGVAQCALVPAGHHWPGAVEGIGGGEQGGEER